MYTHALKTFPGGKEKDTGRPHAAAEGANIPTSEMNLQ
jgi:hypothetical protein